MMTRSITESARETPVVHHTDVLVCGGGPAGTAAALASAASGARTTLLECGGCIGGVWTSGLLTYVLDPKADSPVTSLLISELNQASGYNKRKRLDAMNRQPWAEHSFIYDVEVMKWVLEQQCLKQGIRIQLHTRVCAVVKNPADSSLIHAVITESKSGRQAWTARVVIDTTGDGDVAAQAGCSFDLGRETNGEVQPLTLMCLVSTPYPERLQPICWKGGETLVKELEACGLKPSYGAPVLFEVRENLYGFMMNHKYGSALDAAELSNATFEARDEIQRSIRALRERGGAWEGLRVVATGSQIGVREGRRIRGRYQVTAEDLTSGREHEDAICKVHFPIDVHATGRSTHSAFDPENKIKSRPYDIPLRSLIASECDNLLMAGRCISGDFIAHSSYRVTGNSVAMGEAAGCLAATAVSRGEHPGNVSLADFRAAERGLLPALKRPIG